MPDRAWNESKTAKKEKKYMTKMDKEYIEKEYEQAIKEYNAALTEDDLDTARRTMKRLEASSAKYRLLFRLTISVSVAFQHDF